MKKSESIKELASALARFQAEIKNPKNTAFNPFHKNNYAPLDVILNLVRPVLSENGLSFMQDIDGDGTNIKVSTLLMHKSGEWIHQEGLVIFIKDKIVKDRNGNYVVDKQGNFIFTVTSQDYCSAVTYARRYSLSAMLGISNEDDDDGNQASQLTPKNKQQPSQNGLPKEYVNLKKDVLKLYEKARPLSNKNVTGYMDKIRSGVHEATFEELENAKKNLEKTLLDSANVKLDDVTNDDIPF